MEEKIKQYFPYEKIREQQAVALREAASFLNSEKKYFIIEAGTGVGKSAIGYTLNKILENNSEFDDGAIFITTQKILQDQYMRDFSKFGMRSINSSSNFQCKFFKKNTCAQSLRLLNNTKKGSKFWNCCTIGCNYKKAKSDFIDGNIGVTNFPYFLAETQYSGKIKPKKLLVLDEAHNIPSELSKFVEVVVTSNFCQKFLKLKIPKFNSQRESFEWVRDVYIKKLDGKFKHMKNTIDSLNLDTQVSELLQITRQFELVDKHLCKMRRFVSVYSEENWVYNIIADPHKIEFKPIDVSNFCREMVFNYGDKVVLMSATIMDKDKFCEMVGIKKEEAGFISIKSPFDKNNRPILYCPAGKMNKSNLDNTLPTLIKSIKAIMNNHKGEKGIIHCHTFKIANYIKKNIRSNRLLIHNSENRNQILKKHISSKSPTILLSPSMTEGVDLADDISRFQILCKVPYPYLGDKLIKKKMNKWKWWYSLETAKTIVQSIGRSVRNSDDFAVTYILDEDWGYFFNKNKSVFNEDFISCILR